MSKLESLRATLREMTGNLSEKSETMINLRKEIADLSPASKHSSSIGFELRNRGFDVRPTEGRCQYIVKHEGIEYLLLPMEGNND